MKTICESRNEISIQYYFYIYIFIYNSLLRLLYIVYDKENRENRSGLSQRSSDMMFLMEINHFTVFHFYFLLMTLACFTEPCSLPIIMQF